MYHLEGSSQYKKNAYILSFNRKKEDSLDRFLIKVVDRKRHAQKKCLKHFAKKNSVEVKSLK